jgi:hypothetical protein
VKHDLEHLLGLHPTDLEVVLAKYPGDKVADFCTHIRKAVHEKPWTLVAYAWCFYMAVFSGGRWIRAGLLKAGPDFWQAHGQEEQDTPADTAERGLSFWHFPGHFDGEDIKAEFKLRLAAAETLFTTDERVDIIEEAKNIFQLCASLVEELDDLIASQGPAEDAKGSGKESLLVDEIKSTMSAVKMSKSSDMITRFVQRPEVTGTLVVLGCLACAALFRLP